jgi:hypothetical protein
MTQLGTAVRERNEKLLVARQAVGPATVIGTLQQVRLGSLLIRPGAALPRGIPVPLRRVGEWNLVADLSSSELDQRLRSVGWHLFFVVPPVEAGGLGLSYASAFRKALAGAIRQVGARDLNTLEIGNVRVRQVLNVHHVRLAAYPRHIGDTPFLRDLDPHHRVEGLWNR